MYPKSGQQYSLEFVQHACVKGACLNVSELVNYCWDVNSDWKTLVHKTDLLASYEKRSGLTEMFGSINLDAAALPVTSDPVAFIENFWNHNLTQVTNSTETTMIDVSRLPADFDFGLQTMIVESLKVLHCCNPSYDPEAQMSESDVYGRRVQQDLRYRTRS